MDISFLFSFAFFLLFFSQLFVRPPQTAILLFSIWNSSNGIPSLPLVLFLVMLPKAVLTSHSRISGSRWVITSSWLLHSIVFLYFFALIIEEVFLISPCYSLEFCFQTIPTIKFHLTSQSNLKSDIKAIWKINSILNVKTFKFTKKKKKKWSEQTQGWLLLVLSSEFYFKSTFHSCMLEYLSENMTSGHNFFIYCSIF